MLYFLPTPIGNTQDITLRWLELLKSSSIFLCEDTRTTKKLMNIYEISLIDKQFFALTSYTNESQFASFMKLSNKQNHDIVIVSEAWTPWLSDPGKVLISYCVNHQIPYTILPGANALVPAIVAAWFPTQQFLFLGFLPQKKGRQTTIKQIVSSTIPVFFYESVHRIEKTLTQLEEAWFRGTISMAREVSKMHEQLFTGTLSEIMQQIANKTITIKGEFVMWCWNW